MSKLQDLLTWHSGASWNRHKDKTYNPHVHSPALSEYPVPEYSVGSDGSEVLSGIEHGNGETVVRERKMARMGAEIVRTVTESTHSEAKGGEVEDGDENEGEDGEAEPSVRPVRSKTGTDSRYVY